MKAGKNIPSGINHLKSVNDEKLSPNKLEQVLELSMRKSGLFSVYMLCCNIKQSIKMLYEGFIYMYLPLEQNHFISLQKTHEG